MTRRKEEVILIVAGTIGAVVVYLLWSGSVRCVQAQEKAGSQRPIVKITAPANKSFHPWNMLVSYSIVVSDQGKSTKYQEIPSNQVVLQTRYVPDLSHVEVDSDQATNVEPVGLQEIVGSRCIGCHEFQSTAMGPSFFAIAKRYGHTASAVDTLTKYIRDGSVGVWGQARMPAHPELSEQKLHDIATWILEDAAAPGMNYYAGTEGTFQMSSPGQPGQNAGLVVTASYARPNAGSGAKATSVGEDRIVIRGK